MPEEALHPSGDGHLDDGRRGNTTRRRFVAAGLGAVGATYAAAIGYPVYKYLSDPAERAAELAAITEVRLPKDDIPEPGSVLMFRFGSLPAMLIHHKDGSMVCFSAKCTHLGCTVQFQPDQNRIFCACHEGQYDMKTGENVAGPPPKPLTVFNVEVSDEQVVVSRA